MFKTTFEYLDGKCQEYKTQHMMRCDGSASVYRIIREDRSDPFRVVVIEETIPYCVVRRQWTEVIEGV